MLIMKENDQPSDEFAEPAVEPKFAKFQEFPDECFPEPVRNYVLAQAIALDWDESAVAIPVLSALAASIGGSQRSEVEPGQTEPAILWTAVVGDAKTNNRPVLRAAVRPLVDRQDRALRGYAHQMAEFQKTRAASGTKSDGGLPPAAVDGYVVRDWRTDSLIRLLSRQPRGVLVQGDALAALNRIVDSGAARWVDMPPGKNGGPPYRMVTMGLTSFEPNLDERVGSDETESVARPQSSQEVGILPETTANNTPIASVHNVSPAHDAERRATLVPTDVLPAGQQWTMEELVAADSREHLDVGPGSKKHTDSPEISPPPNPHGPNGSNGSNHGVQLSNGRRKYKRGGRR